MKSSRGLIHATILSLFLIVQVTNIDLVHADGETPVPATTEAVTDTPIAPDTPTEATTDPMVLETATPSPIETSPDTLVDITETSTPTDSVTETPIPETATSAPMDSTDGIDTTSTAANTTVDDIPPLLETIPDNTDMMVLDENGDPLSLVTQEAADIIATRDPVWCPDGQAPTPGNNGCTASYATMEDLLNFEGFYIDSQNVNGTIWITSGAVGDVNDIWLDSWTYSNWANYSLTLQGGWSGINGDTTIGANSVFSVPIYIFDWANSITINNIITTNSLSVSSYSSDVAINDSTFSVSSGNGAFISGSNVSINNSTFSGNSGDGAYISGSNVSINNSTFSGNSGNGAAIYAGNVTINNSTFNNSTVGASIKSSSVSVSNSSFNGNSTGLYINGVITNSYGTPVGVGCVTNTNNVYTANGQDENIINARIAPCTEPTVTPTPSPSSTLNSIILVPPDQNQVEVSIDCDQSSYFFVAWATGDQIQLTCVEGGVVRITRVDNTALNPDLPVGYQYVTAYNVEVFQNGTPLTLMPEGGFVQPMLASRHNNPNYGIMAWNDDKDKWTLLNTFQKDQYGASVIFPFDPSDSQDEQKILQGTRLVINMDPNREFVRTNFPGLFVLVQQQ